MLYYREKHSPTDTWGGLIVFSSDEFMQQDKSSTLNYRHSLCVSLAFLKLFFSSLMKFKSSFIRDDLNALYSLKTEDFYSYFRNMGLKCKLKFL